MNLLQQKYLETKRLYLSKTEVSDLKELWNILSLESVNKNYFSSTSNLDKSLKDWYNGISNEISKSSSFYWTIKLKDSKEIIGLISALNIDNSTKEFTCFIEPIFQKQGYAYEATLEVLKYMFIEIEVEKLKTKVNKTNISCLKLIEKLGFIRLNSTKSVDTHIYELTKNAFLKEYFKKETLYISEDIDKDPYCKHLSDDLVLNLTGESGSGKTTTAEKYLTDPNCIVICTDQVFGNHPRDKENQEVYDLLVSKYTKLPNLYYEFDQIYLDIINHYKNSGKMLIIDSSEFRNIKDPNILVGDIIVIRTCINNCFNRCIERYKNKNPEASFEEIASYSSKKKNIYTWYHYLNDFLAKVDKLS